MSAGRTWCGEAADARADVDRKTAYVELDHPRERGELPKKARLRRHLPIELDVREPPWHDHDLWWPVTDDLVGDLETTAARISRDSLHRARIVCPAQSITRTVRGTSFHLRST